MSRWPFASGLFALTLALGCAHAEAPPDFSGIWRMDPSRSESAHQDTPIGPVSLTIVQTTADVVIETMRTEAPPKDRHTPAVSRESLRFPLDTADTMETSGPAGPGPPVKAKAHWDGPHLIAETAREMNGSTVTTRQVFELSANGREITIHKSLTVQHGYQGTGTPGTTGSGTDVFVKTGTAKR